MTLKFLPVLPPNLRPILKLQDNTMVTSDLNYTYQNIININNRINQLQNMQVSEKFIKTERVKLQYNINLLFDEEKRIKNNKKLRIINQNLTKKRDKKYIHLIKKLYYSKNTLKSLSKIIKGKTGRIRENLLGKTVDYSARSVIGVEPKLKTYQCAIPIEINEKNIGKIN